jgi:hypothetical protein
LPGACHLALEESTFRGKRFGFEEAYTKTYH